MIKRIVIIWGAGFVLFAGLMLFAQTEHPVAKPTDQKIGMDLISKSCAAGQFLKADGTCETPPTLTTAETIAIAAIEEKKHQAEETWKNLNSQEQQVLTDWASSHKGWKIDPQQGFKVVKDEGKKEEKK